MQIPVLYHSLDKEVCISQLITVVGQRDLGCTMVFNLLYSRNLDIAQLSALAWSMQFPAISPHTTASLLSSVVQPSKMSE